MASLKGTRGSAGQSALLFYLIALLPATAIAFYASYSAGVTFSGLSTTAIVHIHTAMMGLWLIMLLAQAWFAASGRMAFHRAVGRSSYVIAPLIALSLVAVFHELLTRREMPMNTGDLQVNVYNLGMMLGFPLVWALAIRNRRNARRHMRYMISTSFVIASPILFRLILNYFTWVPGMQSFENIVVANGLIIALPLLFLIAKDRRQGIAASPYWIAFGLNAAIHVGYFTFGKSDGWRGLVYWFVGLPLT